MLTAIMALLIAFALGLALNPLLLLICRHTGLVDRPDHGRKLHDRMIPLSGGYALVLALIGTILLLPYYDCNNVIKTLFASRMQLTVLAAGLLIVLVLGGIDDKFDLRPRHKLLFQLVAASFAYFGGIAITIISNPFGGGTISLGILSFPITIFWFLACINAINLVDGLDGLAGGVGLFASLTMALVSYVTGNIMSMFLSACLCGSVLGFLMFNFYPAKVFFGDAGSMSLGFLIGALSLMGSVKSGAAVALVVPIIALGLPAFDTALVITRRWAQRLPVSVGDRRHIHHMLLSKGLSERWVVLILYAVCLTLGGTALLITAGNNVFALILLGVIGILAFAFVRIFALLDLKHIRTRIQEDREIRNRDEQAAVTVDQAINRMKRSETPEECWSAMCECFQGLDVICAEIRWQPEDGPVRHRRWPEGYNEQEKKCDMLTLVLTLGEAKENRGSIVFYFNPERLPGAHLLILARRLRNEWIKLHKCGVRTVDSNESVVKNKTN